MRKKFKLGVIGCGDFGSFCIEAYQKIPEIKIWAVCRREESKLKKCAKRYHVPLIYTDYRDLIKNKDIDIVYIATPPFLHAEQAIAAAEEKKHLIIEKPLALNEKDAERINKAVKKNKVKAIINYVMRYNPIYEKVYEITGSNYFGKLLEVNFENYAKKVPADHWFWDKRKSGGIFVEHGVHFFDIFDDIINSEIIGFSSLSNTDKRVLSALKYKNNVLASFFHAFDKPVEIEKCRIIVSYERGYAEILGWLPLELRLEGLVKNKFIKKSFKIPSTKKELYQNSLRDILLDLIGSIKNPQYKTKVNLEDAIQSLQIALEATKAIK